MRPGIFPASLPIFAKQPPSGLRGYTLVEILAVLVVVAVLAAVVAPKFINLTDEARDRTLQIAITELNGRERLAWLRSKLRQGGTADDEEAFQQVVASDLGPDFLWQGTPARTGSSQLLFRGKTYSLQRAVSNPDRAGRWALFQGILHDFTTVAPGDFLQQPNNSWFADPANGFSTNTWGARIYTPNPLADGNYEIGITAQLGPARPDLARPDGGYGIFFDATLDGSGQLQSGYALQFDRGLGDGEIVLRRWENGAELTVPLLRISDRNIIPRKTVDPDWWSQEHNLSLRVTAVPGQPGMRRLEILLDGTAISDSFTFAPAAGDTHTGLRSWGSFASPTQFSTLEIGSP